MEQVFEDIHKDIARTYLVSADASLQTELFRILTAVAYVKPSIGYCQGMNFIAAVLLKVIGSEEVTFWMFLGMLKRFDMECMFIPGVPDLALREFQLNHYLKLHLPDLSTHFRKVGVTNAFFVSRWFMTLFSVFLPFEVLLKVWDCFFMQGWKVLIKVGISLFKLTKNELLNSDLDEISIVIRDTLRTQKIDVRALMEGARGVHVSNAELKRMENQFFMDQTNIKLMAIDHSLGYSDSEISAFRWARSELNSLDSSTKTDVKELQGRLEKIENDLECFYSHYLTVSMELLHVQNDMDLLLEKQALFQDALQSMENDYKRQKRKKIFAFMKRAKTDDMKEGAICLDDIHMLQKKLFHINEEIKCLMAQQSEKSLVFKEAKLRIEEIKEKKANYSSQLCGVIRSLNSMR